MLNSPQRNKKAGLTKKVVSQGSRYSGHRERAVSSFLTVRVLNATHLLASDIQREPPASDPVCFIWCGNSGQLPSIHDSLRPGEEGNPFFTTKVVNSTINPTWNEEIVIPLAVMLPGTDTGVEEAATEERLLKKDPLAQLLELRCFVYLRDEDINEDGSVTYDELGMTELTFTDLFSRARPLSNGLTINAQPYIIKKTPGMPNLGLNANLGTITLGVTVTIEDDILGVQIKSALGADNGTFRDKQLFERLQRAARGEPMEPPARPSTSDGLRSSRDRGRSSSPATQPRPHTAGGSVRPSSASAGGSSVVRSRAQETGQLKEEEAEESNVDEAEELLDVGEGGRGQHEEDSSVANQNPDLDVEEKDSSVAPPNVHEEEEEGWNRPRAELADTLQEEVKIGSLGMKVDKAPEDEEAFDQGGDNGAIKMNEANSSGLSEPEVTGRYETTEPPISAPATQEPASSESNTEEETPSLLAPTPSLEPTLLENQVSTAVPVGGGGRAAAVALRTRDWEILNSSLEDLARITQEGLRDLGSRLSAVERNIEKDFLAAASNARGTRKSLTRESKAGVTPSSSILSLPATVGKRGKGGSQQLCKEASGASSDAFKKFRHSRSDASVRNPGGVGAPPSMELVHKTADGIVCSAPLGDESAMSPQRRSIDHFAEISVNGGGVCAGGGASSRSINVAPPPRAALNAIFPLATPVPAMPDWDRVTLWLRGGDLVSAYCEVLDRGTPTDFGRLLAEGGLTPSALSVSVLNRACDQVALLLQQGPGQFTEIGLLFVLAILRNGRGSCASDCVVMGCSLLPRTKEGLVEALGLIADLPSKQGLLAGLLQTQLSR